jgi:hypothetical protein
LGDLASILGIVSLALVALKVGKMNPVTVSVGRATFILNFVLLLYLLHCTRFGMLHLADRRLKALPEFIGQMRS